MTTPPPGPVLFDRELDAWPSGSAARFAVLAPRSWRLRAAGAFGLGGLAGGLMFLHLWQSVPASSASHPWLVLVAFWFAAMISLAVALLVGLTLGRFWLPDLRVNRVVGVNVPGKAASPRDAPPGRPGPFVWTRSAVGTLVLFLACPILFVLLIVGGNLMIFADPTLRHPYWHWLIPPAVAAVPTLGLAAVARLFCWPL